MNKNGWQPGWLCVNLSDSAGQGAGIGGCGMTAYEVMKEKASQLNGLADKLKRILGEFSKAALDSPNIEYCLGLRNLSDDAQQKIKAILEQEAEMILKESETIKNKLSMVDSLLEGEK